MQLLLALTALAASVTALPTVISSDLGIAEAGPPVLIERDIPILEERAHLVGESPQGALSTKDRAILHHNLHRMNHSAVNVTWDSNLANSARVLAERCVFAHNTSIGGGGYGQNLAAGVPESNITASITTLWYGSEFPFYTYYGKEPDLNTLAQWGHFTQVVWSTSTTIGCWVNDCSSKPGKLANVGSNVPPILTVCNYGPPGNYVGNFAKSVNRPLGLPQARWNTGL